MPPGWVCVPSGADFYYWNTSTNEVSWEHPSEPKREAPEVVAAPVFTEEYKALWSDIGRMIGRQGINLKIIKASLGCEIKVPRQGGGKGKGKGKDAKGKDAKGKGKDKGDVVRGAGTGKAGVFDDEQFAKIQIIGSTQHEARGGLRCLQIMLGYARPVERALAELGVEVKMPPDDELEDLKAKESKGKGKDKDKDGLDPMDPASYSECPQGTWSDGKKKPAQQKTGLGAWRANAGRNEGGVSGLDSKTANAERC